MHSRWPVRLPAPVLSRSVSADSLGRGAFRYHRRYQARSLLPRSAPTEVGDRGEDPAINRCSRRLARSGDVGMRRSPDGVRVQHCAARCGHNCGHPVASERPAWSVIRDPRTAQPCHPSVDLQRNQSSHGAAGGGASSALSSCLSSKSEHEHRGVERWVASTFSHRDLNFSDMYAEIFAERRRHCDVINSFGFT